MDLSKLSLSDKIIGGTGIGLLISLLFFPWHSIDLGPFGGSVTRTAIQSPNQGWGLLALLLTIAIVAVVALQFFSPDTKLPELPITWNKAVFFATIAVAALLLLKLVVETDFLGFGAWLSLILAAGMVYGGFVRSQQESPVGPSDTADQ